MRPSPDPAGPPRRPRSSAPLSAPDIGYLKAVGDAVRAAPTERDRHLAVQLALDIARRHRLNGVGWSPIVVALGVDDVELRQWLLDAGDAKPAAGSHPAGARHRVELAAPDPPYRRGAESGWIDQTASVSQSASQSLASSASSRYGGLNAGSQVMTGHSRCLMFASGDPRPGGNQFGLEAAAVRQLLTLARVEVREVACVALSEIAQHLARVRPLALHVAAHNAFGGIYLSLDGAALSVAHTAFLDAVRRSHPPPRLVVLNTCHSARLARALVDDGIESSLGWPSEVNDDQARLFAAQLYQALGNGVPVADGCADASATVAQRWPHIEAVEPYGSGEIHIF
ncbi:MAG TPA: CHAT domain-containing protein [Micromonosporaceae bacterium]|nr:CHAT domain-containing protein [Micromonosporaceae bacterium]